MNRIAYWLPSMVLLFGCASASDGGAEDAGSLSLELEANGVMLDHVTYTITGENFSRTNVVDVTKSTRISALIGGLPVGHLEVSLTATDANDPAMTCSGWGAFDVRPRETTETSVNLYCRKDTSSGSVAINGTVVRCPTLDGVTAEPSETTVGETIDLSVQTVDPDSLFTYEWTATGGTLSGADTSEAQLTCTAPGRVKVTVIVNGDTGLCGEGLTATVYCTSTEPPDGDQDDPSTPGDDRAGYMVCNNQTCNPGFICCSGEAGCAESPSACVDAGAPDYLGYATCDGPEDCGPGESCAGARHWVSCGPASFYGIRCHRDSDCVSTPEYPNPCQPGGYCDGPWE